MSPETQKSLSVLAEASATKENNRQSSSKTIFASSDEDDVTGGAVGELSNIIKSDDSPDTMSERGGSRLGDVSFSELGDLSMLHASRNGTPFNKSSMLDDSSSSLSPIATKSQDLSMIPYLNQMTLDVSMSGCDSNPPSAVARAVMDSIGMSSCARNGRPTPGSAQSTTSRRSVNAHQAADRAMAMDSSNVSGTMSRSQLLQFGTSTKRKRHYGGGAEDSDGDATRAYGQEEEEGEQTASSGSGSSGLSQSQQLGRTRSSSNRTSKRLWGEDADDSMHSAANDSSYQHNVTSLVGAHSTKYALFHFWLIFCDAIHSLTCFILSLICLFVFPVG